MGFNGDNLKAIFDQRFGQGAFDSGVNQAYQNGRNQWLAQQQALQQKMFMDSLKQQQAQQKAQQKDPVYQLQHASDYFTSAGTDRTKNKILNDLLTKGAFKWVNDLQNDPTQQAQLKAQGYNLNNLMDQAYNVASNGKFKSAKAFGQYFKDADAQAKRDNAEAKANTGFSNIDQIQQVIDKDKEAQAQAQQDQLQRANDTLLAIHNDAVQRQVQNQGVGNFGYELQRGVARFGNALTLGGLGELDSKLHGGALNPLLTDRNGSAGWLDKGVDLAGSTLPFLLSDGATSALGGAKLAGLGAKGIAGKVGELAIRGAGSGALVGAGQEGMNAAFNPNQFDLKQALENVGLNAGLGAVANPLLHGAGGLLKQLNLKGQLANVLEHNQTQIDPEAFMKTLQEMKQPNGNFSNVVADTKPNMPQPFEQKYNINLPNKAAPTTTPDVSQNNWFNFAQQGSNMPIGRGLFLHDTTVPKAQSGAIRSMADDTLNRANAFSNAPAEGFNQRLLNVQQEMHGTRQTNSSIQKEFKNAVQQQYEHLKDSMGKGTDSGTTSNGLHGNFKQVTGTYNVSKNPKWYQDFLKTSGGRKPNEAELRQLAEEHVRKGFQDEHGNISAWKPQDLQHVHDQIDEIHSMLADHPEQAHVLAPILRGLEQDEARLVTAHKNVLAGKTPDINELYVNSKGGSDPKKFEELIKLAEMEHNAANPGLTSMLRTDPKIKQGIKALNDLGKPTAKAPKVEAPKKPTVKVPELKNTKNPHDILKNIKVESSPKASSKGSDIPGKALMPTPKSGIPKTGDIMKGIEVQSKYVLNSIKTDKNVLQMTRDELGSTLTKLEKKRDLLASGGKNTKEVEEDINKVQSLLKMDLQTFGEKAQKKTPEEVAKQAKQEAAIKHSQAEQAAKKIEEKGGTISADEVKQLQESKDILPFSILRKNLYELLDRLPKRMGDRIRTALDNGKKGHVDNLEKRTNDLYDKIVHKDGFGIDKGSKESALVQDFGEKTLAKQFLEKQGKDPAKVSKEELDKINLEQLKQKAPEKWQKIVEADKYFREEYNKLIDEVNATRTKIYPNDPEKLVPKREDYYHHFNELEGFEGFKNLLENSNAIDPHLAGISPNTKPNAKWASFMQKRGNGGYKSDAVGGFLKYLQASSYSTHIDPVIKVIRDEAENIATATEGDRNLNNLKTSLVLHADDLAGKTNPKDRVFQDYEAGRKAFKIINWLNGHYKKNQILGNLSSALGQIGNIPLTAGKAKLYTIPGAMDTLKGAARRFLPGAEKGTAPIDQSQFIKERFSSKYFKQFDNSLLKKPEHMAAWLLETADKAGTYTAWNSMYRKAVAEKIVDPIKYADDQTRHIIAGRGIGEVPLRQKSKIVGIMTPFTYEVGNAWKVLGKQVSEKDFAGIMTFLAVSWGLNSVMRNVRGNDVSFNPIGAILDGWNDKKALTTTDKSELAGGNLLGEIVGNIPGGAYVPQILKMASPSLKKTLFGNNSPDRYGTGVGVASGMFAPIGDLIDHNPAQAAKDAAKILLPFGGNQVQKTASGAVALSKGGAYNKKGQFEYPVDSHNAADVLQALLLGPSTTAGGRDYFKNHKTAFSDKQTQQLESGLRSYQDIQNERDRKSIIKQIKDIQKGSDDPTTKMKKIAALMAQMQQAK